MSRKEIQSVQFSCCTYIVQCKDQTKNQQVYFTNFSCCVFFVPKKYVSFSRQVILGLIFPTQTVSQNDSNCPYVVQYYFSNLQPDCSFSNLFNPLNPKIHIQILQTDLHTFLLRTVKRINVLRSKHSPFGNQFSNSHNLYSWWSADVVRRKLILVTLGT